MDILENVSLIAMMATDLACQEIFVILLRRVLSCLKLYAVDTDL